MRLLIRLSTLFTVTLLSGCSVTAQLGQPQPRADVVYVCHGREARSLRVSASAADAHRRHGDRISEQVQEEGAACEK